MTTLYDVLGLSRQASPAQVEQAYKFSVESISMDGNQTSEQETIRAKAIKDAYTVLSSPSRRQAYNEKLEAKLNPVSYEVMETPGVPWVKMIVVSAVLLIGALYIYKEQSHKAEVQRLAFEAEKAKAEAVRAENMAAIEQARLDKQRLFDKNMEEANSRREMENARIEGRKIDAEMRQSDARIAREKEQADRREQNEKQREEQAAKDRIRNETAAMQRALNIPIRRH